MLLDRLFPRRASLEDPTTPLTGFHLTAAQVFGDGAKSDSGAIVNGKTALNNSAVWAAVDVITSAVGKLPINLHRQQAQKKEIFRSHPGHRLMHNRPNDFMGPLDFKRTVQMGALIYGTGYAEIERDGGARPISLTPLPSGMTHQVMMDGELWVVTNVSGSQRKIPAIDCLIIRGLSREGLLGHAIIDVGKNAIGMGMAMSKFINKFYSNNARPSTVLKHPGQLNEESAKRLRESWEQIHKGLDNSHRTAVLEEGMDVATLGTTPEHAQMVESLSWGVLEVARYFRIPPHKLSWLEKSTFNNLNEQERQFLVDTLDPWLTNWEEEANFKLLTETEKESGDVFFKFNAGKLLRMSFKEQVDALTLATGGPFMIRNEARDIMDLNPVEEYDVPLEPNSNAVPSSADKPEEIIEVVEELSFKPTASQRRLIEQTLHRMTTRLVNKANKAAKQGGNFLEFLEKEFKSDVKVFEAISDAVAVIAELRGDDPEAETHRITDRLLLTCRDELFAETEKRTADEFPGAVEILTAGWLTRIPRQITIEFLEGV